MTARAKIDPFAPLIAAGDNRAVIELAREIPLSNAAAEFLLGMKINRGGRQKDPATKRRHQHLARAVLHFRKLRDDGREDALEATCEEFRITAELLRELNRGGNRHVRKILASR